MARYLQSVRYWGNTGTWLAESRNDNDGPYRQRQPCPSLPLSALATNVGMVSATDVVSVSATNISALLARNVDNISATLAPDIGNIVLISSWDLTVYQWPISGIIRENEIYTWTYIEQFKDTHSREYCKTKRETSRSEKLENTIFWIILIAIDFCFFLFRCTAKVALKLVGYFIRSYCLTAVNALSENSL